MRWRTEMKKISEIDKNFNIKTNIDKQDICFYDIKENQSCLFGVRWDNGFRRMPESIAKNVSEGVYALHTNTSGGRIRFSTDSPYVAISANIKSIVSFSHMPQTGVSGFDMYVDEIFKGAFIPPLDMSDGFNGILNLQDRKKHNITINFPLYNNVSDLYIGLADGTSFEPITSYSCNKTIIFYGSSITQGGCVSRPGNSYPSHISRMLDCDYVNLGFSGNAKGELVMAEYIAELNPSVFVMDYDHNAPTREFLEKTHENFFKKFRAIRKNTPVVFVSAPNIRFCHVEWAQRREIIKMTYQNALSNGDKNVYFIDGETLWDGDCWDACTVDCIHPNDLGHFRMAKKIAPIIRTILNTIA